MEPRLRQGNAMKRQVGRHLAPSLKHANFRIIGRCARTPPPLAKDANLDLLILMDSTDEHRPGGGARPDSTWRRRNAPQTADAAVCRMPPPFPPNGAVYRALIGVDLSAACSQLRRAFSHIDEGRINMNRAQTPVTIMSTCVSGCSKNPCTMRARRRS